MLIVFILSFLSQKNYVGIFSVVIVWSRKGRFYTAPVQRIDRYFKVFEEPYEWLHVHARNQLPPSFAATLDGYRDR